jgi:predicted ATPase
LPLLSEKEVADYIERRFPHSSLPSRLVQLIHQQTDGNPLFMLNVADYLQKQGIIALRDGQWRITAPLEELRFDLLTDIQDIIDTQLNHLSSQEEQLLKAASVAGVEFSIAAVAAGLQATVEEAEEWCEALARRSLFLRAQGSEEWPDGTLASRYPFINLLYQQGWYERVTAAKRVQLHQRLGERQEQGYGERASEIATELAVHFERGRQMPRAVHYRIQAANNALRRFGYQEAATHLAKGIELLTQLPGKVERIQQEIVLQSALGAVETALQGYASPAVERAYARAQVLCQQMGTVSYLVPVLRGL